MVESAGCVISWPVQPIRIIGYKMASITLGMSLDDFIIFLHIGRQYSTRVEITVRHCNIIARVLRVILINTSQKIEVL